MCGFRSNLFLTAQVCSPAMPHPNNPQGHVGSADSITDRPSQAQRSIIPLKTGHTWWAYWRSCAETDGLPLPSGLRSREHHEFFATYPQLFGNQNARECHLSPLQCFQNISPQSSPQTLCLPNPFCVPDRNSPQSPRPSCHTHIRTVSRCLCTYFISFCLSGLNAPYGKDCHSSQMSSGNGFTLMLADASLKSKDAL